MNKQLFITLALPDDFEMLHIGFSARLNAECAVLPPSSSVAAIPEEATAMAISPRHLISAYIKFIRNVFPVPPGASKK